MDDLNERQAALEATVGAEVRALRGEMAAIVRRLDHLDECLDRQRDAITKSTREAMESIERKVGSAMESVKAQISAAVDFPKRVAWLIVATVLVGFLSAVAALVWSSGKETTRVIRLPTTPAPVERSEE